MTSSVATPPPWQPPPRRVQRPLERVVATTDVHSSLDQAEPMAAQLRTLRDDGALIADCGDFFEGSGYYVLGGGRVETALLTGLYDVTAPGNHGYRHHLDDPALASITVCANVLDHAGSPVWAPLLIAEIGGRTVAVTAVLGVEAFTSIPPGQRVGHHILDPAAALRALHDDHTHKQNGQVEEWIVLSHAGFTHDLALAHACPFASVIFSGHCHSETSGPVSSAGAIVVKGAELGVGYSTAQPTTAQPTITQAGSARAGEVSWRAAIYRFPPAREMQPPARRAAGSSAAGVEEALAELAGIRRTLATPIGALPERFACRRPPRRRLLSHLADAVLTVTGAQAAMLNLTCLRPRSLGRVLTVGDLMSLEPFGNTLTCVTTTDPAALAAHLLACSGPLVCTPRPLPPAGTPVTVAVTGYLADTHLPGGARAGRVECRQFPVRDVLRNVLLGLPALDPHDLDSHAADALREF